MRKVSINKHGGQESIVIMMNPEGRQADKFWTGSGLSSEYPDAKIYNYKEMINEVKKIENKYPDANIVGIANYGNYSGGVNYERIVYPYDARDIAKKSNYKKADDKPGKIFTLSFPTKELLDLFGLPDLETEIILDYYPSDDVAKEELLYYTDMDEDEIEEAIQNHPDLLDDVKFAMNAAYESGTAGKYYRVVLDSLEEILGTFSDYKYEFYSENDRRTYSGVAKGIITESIDIKADKTTFKADSDLAKVVQDNIAGYGEFDVDSDYEGETPEEYAKSRFHWLAYYWEIYGSRKPEPDLDRIDDFDNNYFKELMVDIKSQYGL